MSSPSSYGRSLESTPTWAVAVVVFVLVAISLVIEQILHHVGSTLRGSDLQGTPHLAVDICIFGASHPLYSGLQFFTSVEKVDYVTLRHGFIIAHLTPQSHVSFDFQKYINRSLEGDFKVVVGISPIMWLFAVLFLLANTNGWHSQFWLPFIPLIITLLVGAKLQVIITKMGIRILERGDIIKGTPVVQPSDDLFWFKSPKLILFLIHFVLFQNAFQLAFFFWSWYTFGYPSCYHRNLADITIRIVMGVLIQFLCSYVTLPLYALVTQMGSTMKPVIFSDQVASAIRGWHHTAKKQLKLQGQQSGNTTPFSSRPGTPLRGNMSPLYLLGGLQNNHDSFENGYQISPRTSSFGNEGWGGGEGTSVSPHHHEIEIDDSLRNGMNHSEIEIDIEDPRPNNVEAEPQVQISLSELSFRKI
ncbi:hypothetical protein RD792_008122 [Penstemon davidsonii]|uniref:MLO-like protein n=1 Tax=Penstemon davidsonii TaxID=160366 RepID=A0ABR0D8D2_9LAMI|nr:hypothetical protein RD792_008122 [Penstemon davidsonii]